ncbi:ImmA/IrrE family metallo-endopeptidase [Paenibacillus solani]|uniref:ImmA/IrrE family metallo-endopeptidase n=1 Tax=Paenibacillus solani TaxID=1705565 RepID=UPI003D2DFC0F
MLYEELQAEAESYGVDVFEMVFRGNLKGMYKDNSIAIRIDLKDQAEKACILAEELGHFHTTVGNILDQRDIRKRKQELRARQWAYERIIPLSAIVQAYEAKVKGRYEIAEYLNVTEEFLQASIDRYRDRFGILVSTENYIILLDHLHVIRVSA